MPHRPTQLSFPVFLREQSTFENFVAESNSAKLAVHGLKKLACEDLPENILLWGTGGSGLSHLLQASCQLAAESSKLVQYLPLGDLIGYSPDDVLGDLSLVNLLCMDDVHLCAGNADWERALFHLYNELKACGGSLICAMHQSPAELAISLPDLRSRLLSAPTFQVPALSDAGKVKALIMRADSASMELSQEVANYLISRVSRTPEDLFSALSRLERASISQQRKLTIPFVKQELNLL